MTETPEPCSQVLVARATAGDRLAVDELIRLHESRLMAFVRMRVGPTLLAYESVRDILQDVLLEVSRGVSRIEYRGEAAFRAWLYSIAEHRILDRVRFYERRSGHEAQAGSGGGGSEVDKILTSSFGSLLDPAESLARREDLRRLERVFASLEADDREILTLSVVCELSTREIAERFGLTEEVARKRKTRAMTRLASLWARSERAKHGADR